MIGAALDYIQKRLDAHLRTVTIPATEGGGLARVSFPEGDKLDLLSIPK
jgi:hypothetical protein